MPEVSKTSRTVHFILVSRTSPLLTKSRIDMRAAAAHNGGSCQVSISYDFGKTFKALKSFIGDCPRGAVDNQLTTKNQTFEFWVPPETPGGSAIFAW